MLTTYLPHPFLVASGLLFAFTGWTFISERRRAKSPHPKTRNPLRLGIESFFLGFGVLVFSLGAPVILDGRFRVDSEYGLVMVSMSLALGSAYFMAPYMGYNLLWNTRWGNFDGPAALFLALFLAMLFFVMGVKAQFGL